MQVLPERFQSAVDFASFAHAGRFFPEDHEEYNVLQMRKFSDGVEYIAHPIRCAMAALRIGLSDDLVRGLLLHDVIEDCGVTRQQVEAEFGVVVADIVWGLTHADARFDAIALGWGREKRKACDRMFLSNQSADTRMGKLIDVTDNLRDWPVKDKFLDRFLEEAGLLGRALTKNGGIWADVIGDFLRVYGEVLQRRDNYKLSQKEGGK